MGAHDPAAFVTPLPHPGELLREDFLAEYGLTPASLARAVGLKDGIGIERIVDGAEPITADIALRLARVFGTSAELWMHMQAAHELSKAAVEARDEFAAIERLESACFTPEAKATAGG